MLSAALEMLEMEEDEEEEEPVLESGAGANAL